ncbi:YiiX/YebB-like N1pC/P60 family cysteine hydrolase [Solimonas sp. K1W22B-7]|uniref:YiiX/YebB-like N1pC/P60 family cysteine hydrolase n=1 Tax=Solimonas sp. K1W22B-7 TaxID=2303331 RepID=UPI0013C4E5D9|nr:YiiX/YebB-like N1pC/P60 family cysteine hydrolase [Solimonas sp. K1W22B-7]
MLHELKTGDLLLFSGKSGPSESIKWVTLSRWSHVALVLREPRYEFPCLWEASTDATIACLESGVARRGVQLVPAPARLDEYDGDIAWRRLQDVDLEPEAVERLAALRRQLTGRAYESNVLELMGAAYDGPFGEQRENLAELFCSELVAAAYQALGLIRPDAKPSNEYVPADFSEQWERLPWLRGRLGPEVLLKNA